MPRDKSFFQFVNQSEEYINNYEALQDPITKELEETQPEYHEYKQELDELDLPEYL